MWYSSFTTRYYVFVVSIAPIGHQRRLKLLCEDLVEIRGLLRYKNRPSVTSTETADTSEDVHIF